MNDIQRSIADDDVSGVSDGKSFFSQTNAVALMLRNGAVSFGPSYVDDVATETDQFSAARLVVDCSDTFLWGCEDQEALAYDEIENLYRLWRKDPVGGTDVWCMIQRREMPQKPLEDLMRERAIWDLDALRAEYALRANRYDGLLEVAARHKHEAYSAWAARIGERPEQYDDNPGWWDGWNRYVEHHPQWYDEAWEAEDGRRDEAWLRRNGFAT